MTDPSSFHLEYDKPDDLYVHVDGEGYLIKEPCVIEVSWHDQISMNINKVKTPTSKTLSDILSVLNKAEADSAITAGQKTQLYERFARCI